MANATRLALENGQLAGEVGLGDLVICRTTAPLISLCFGLIRQGIQARVRGRDIVRNLAAILTPLEKLRLVGSFAFNRGNFIECLKAEEARSVELARRAVRAGASLTTVDLARDKFQTVKEIYLVQAEKPRSAQAMKKRVLSFFSDTKASVWLSTIHRAKGLEANRVFFLKPSQVPHPRAAKTWEKVQEMNCKYVALTRAKHSLFFVNEVG